MFPACSSGSYEDAITTLNSLQTNAALLARVRKERQRNVHLNLEVTTKYLERSGMTLADLDNIKIIHVSGTKGKGSTCAFCESILRHEGLTTGFFSSPHLVSVTERIRINGSPIQEDKFTSYFWQVYDSVCRGYPEEDRPPYFKFLTILAFNIFWKEKLDVAVVEVGIGGAFDCTNIVRKPVVSGITSLGLDHTSLLGNSISEIAWHKAGILKCGVTTYVDPGQPESALRVIQDRAREREAQVVLVGRLEEHQWQGRKPILGLRGSVQECNASLGVALASHFLCVTRGFVPPRVSPCVSPDLPTLLPLAISPGCAQGLEETVWPGRTQLLCRPGLHWCLDGAHTQESMEACIHWWKLLTTPDTVFRVLLFNATGDRNIQTLLKPLIHLDMDLVVFCTNLSNSTDRKDQENFTTTSQEQMERCEEQLDMWRSLQTGDTSTPAVIIPYINDALMYVCGGREPGLQGIQPQHRVPQALEKAELVQVLVTGSLHLVGGVLACLQSTGHTVGLV